MKLSILLLFTTILNLWANDSYSQKNRITLDMKNATVDKIIDEIEGTTEFRFIYNVKDVNLNRKTSIRAKKVKIEKLLNDLFSGTSTSYKVKGKQIILTNDTRSGNGPRPFTNFQQTIIGKVTNEEGTPLPGVTVSIQNTNKGTVTNVDGEYEIAVDPEGILVFSYLGYKEREVPVEGRREINVQLVEDIYSLGEVEINAGYYNTTRRESTGNISKVTAEDIQNQPVTNVLAAVQGRMAGVNIIQNSGTPGGGFTIRIRGTNSLRSDGNAPLYIIDGVPVAEQNASTLAGAILPGGAINPLNAIDPNHIESIEVLKDADATAIYGSRGGNGVVLITTKKGKSGKTSFRVNSSYGISHVASQMEMMDTRQYLEMRRIAFANDNINTLPDYAHDVNGTWSDQRTTDWQKELIGKTANTSSLQLSANGGSENTSFIVSGSHIDQTTVFSDDFSYKTSNLSTNIRHYSSDRKFQMTLSGLFAAQSNNVVNDDFTRPALYLSPNAPQLYTQDGSLNWEDNTFTNPVAAFESKYGYESKAFNTNLNLSYKLLSALRLKLNGGINYLSFAENSHRPHIMYNPAYGLTPANSMAFIGNQNMFSFLLEPQLQYDMRLGQHDMEFLIGSTYQQTTNEMLNAEGYGFQSNALLSNLSAATTQVVSQDSRSEYKYAAMFGRINYKFKQKYILNITGRRDGSSRFGPENRFANFGAFGAAWLFSRENFFTGFSWLNHGKLRGSYGTTGSDQIGDYQYLDTYQVSPNLYGNYTGLLPSRLYNPNFSWEKTTKLEAALEVGLWEERLNVSLVWFQNRSGNQLVGIPLPGMTGFSTILANLPATVENTGWEIDATFDALRSGAFKWQTSLNLSVPRNKLVAFPGLEGSTYANRYVIGQPTSIVKLYNFEGIHPQTGLYRFTDQNNDGEITAPDDNTVTEDIGVRYFGGFSNSLSFKNWSLSFLFHFVKQKQWNYNSMMPTPGSMNNQPVEVGNFWSLENPSGAYMPYTSGADPVKNLLHGYLMESTAAVSDASFLRLKNIQLNYRIPLSNFASDAVLYVQGQNLLTFTRYFGQDPEFTQLGFVPPLKTVAFGAQLTF